MMIQARCDFIVTCKECGKINQYPFGTGKKFKDLICSGCGENAYFGNLSKRLKALTHGRKTKGVPKK